MMESIAPVVNLHTAVQAKPVTEIIGEGKFGYHYTSKSLWEIIKKDGLIPYTITSEDLRIIHPTPVRGIWLWAQEMTGKSHAGAIIYQMLTKQDPVIVKLKVSYQDSDLLQYNGKPLEMPHTGETAAQFHDCDIGVIHLAPILVDRIEKIAEYDVIELLK